MSFLFSLPSEAESQPTSEPWMNAPNYRSTRARLERSAPRWHGDREETSLSDGARQCATTSRNPTPRPSTSSAGHKGARSSHLQLHEARIAGQIPGPIAKSRVDINNIGNVMRIPCSTAVLSAVSLVPGTNADTCEDPLSAARVKAVLNAASTALGFVTASGPMWPPVLT